MKVNPQIVLDECLRVNPIMGISCVRSALMYYEKGDRESAIATCLSEDDKIRSYPTVRGLLFQLLPEYFESLNKTRRMFGWDSV